MVVGVTLQHTLHFAALPGLQAQRQLVGTNDEIIDLQFVGPDDGRLAVATTSEQVSAPEHAADMLPPPVWGGGAVDLARWLTACENLVVHGVTRWVQIRVYDLTTRSCVLLSGHTDVVLSLHSTGSLLASGSKDHSVRLWHVQDEGRCVPPVVTGCPRAACTARTGASPGARFVRQRRRLRWLRLRGCGSVMCVGVGVGHTEAVGAVALPRKPSSRFFVSGSEDRTVKCWTWSEEHVGRVADSDAEGQEPARLGTAYTTVAHDKDINTIAIAPNDKLFATGSQDRTAKVGRMPSTVSAVW